MLLETFSDRFLPSLEKEMRAAVQTTDPYRAELYGILQYHLGWVDAAFDPCQAQAGKRVRPMLCLLACESCGGDWEQALPAGAAVELLHNFSLVHDDIEDRDETRRGRPALWTVWGESHGINAGDTLFALTQLAMLRLSERNVPAATVVAAMHLLGNVSVTLTSGQHLDIGFENKSDVPVADYLIMIEGKTAALLACSCELGALVAAAPDARRECLRSFGRHLGLAFQMHDDILGIWGDPAITGKPVGADVARRKKSLPILHGLEHSAELGAVLAQETLSDADVHHATELLGETNSREYAEQLAREHHNQALGAMEQANLQDPAAQALYELAQMLLGRKR